MRIDASDPGAVPLYTVPEAAHYIAMSPATLRSWVIGRSYPIKDGTAWSEPLTRLRAGERPRLSFFNLIEAHMLSAFRTQARVRMGAIRLALSNLRRRLGDELYPFARRSFLTDGIGLFLEEAGRLIDLTEPRQGLIRDAVETNALRVEWDEGELPRQFHPHTRADKTGPTAVVINPRIAFGRPMIEGVATRVLAERFFAGESLDELCRDYGLSADIIEEAIRCENWEKAA